MKLMAIIQNNNKTNKTNTKYSMVSYIRLKPNKQKVTNEWKLFYNQTYNWYKPNTYLLNEKSKIITQ